MMMVFGGLVVVILAVVIWQWINHNANAGLEQKEKRKSVPQAARDILDIRFAKGEISRDEYMAYLEDIEDDKRYWQG
ncbi:MAG: hypothetical protein IT320_00375 [Anaerolineae bacterium]|nr:hypothetical protein [Anaerolineae bacterium]